MSEPLAFFLTWTTYGTWLPGDERGWVDDRLRQAAPGLRQSAEEKLRQAPIVLTPNQRSVVERTVREVCEHNGWRLWAVNCRSNHIHVVVTAKDKSPEQVMNTLKSWCSRRLNESSDSGPKQRWTRHGSTRYLNDESSLESAIEYVVNGQEGTRFIAQ